VDGIARVDRIDRSGGQWKIFFQASQDLTDQMVAKGSATIAGVSLTLVDVEPTGFSIALIPTTLGQTTLAGLSAGEEVNIETDLIGKYVRKFLQAAPGKEGLSMQKLRDAGFA
jgi:riboflavin synthase